jgi:hypothetical protein
VPCDLETYLYPHTVLRKVVAEGVSFASEAQVRGSNCLSCQE